MNQLEMVPIKKDKKSGEITPEKSYNFDEKTKETIDNIFAKHISALSDLEKRVGDYQGGENEYLKLRADITNNDYALGTMVGERLRPDGSRQLTEDMKIINSFLEKDQEERNKNPGKSLDLQNYLREKFKEVQTGTNKILEELMKRHSNPEIKSN
jgi:hypothetical protein